MKKIAGIMIGLCMMFGLAGCNAITIDGEGEAVPVTVPLGFLSPH